MPAPSTAFEAGLHAVAVGGALFAFGFLITGSFAARLGLGIASRFALAVPSLIGFVAIVMVVHVATGGGVLSRPGLVRAVTGASVAVFAIGSLRGSSRRTGSWRDRDAMLALAVIVLGIVVWCLPVFTNLPLSFSGDVKRHMAWAAQLSSGHSTPTAVITGDVPNYYPWLFHALASFTSVFTPGGRVLHALGPLQVLAAVGTTLAFFGLGKELFGSRVAALGSAVFGAMSGGFGFLLARGPELVVDPRVEADVFRFNGDFMFLRSYNLAFHGLAPPFPRDFGFLLLVAMALLLALAVKQQRWLPFAAAGCTLGLIGLTTGESFIVGALSALVLIVSGPGISRMRAAAAFFGPAVGLSSLWLVPLAISYVRLGGFADTSGAPVTLPPLMILFSWGIAAPLAAIGLVSWRRWPSVAARVVASLGSVTVVTVLAAGLAPVLDEGFTTLARHHRYWPLVYVGVALSAAFGFALLLGYLDRFHRALAAGVAVLLVGAAIASPLLASAALSGQAVGPEDLARALRGDASNVLNVLGAGGRGTCTAAVPHELSRTVPAYTGARLVYFRSATRNQAGIRWPVLPDEVPDSVRAADNRMLFGAGASNDEWLGVLRSYGVDTVVASASGSLPSVATRYPQSSGNGEQGSYIVVRTGPCS